MTIVEPIKNKDDIKKVENVLAKKNGRDLLLFVIGTNCGLRISDILSLDVGDVKGQSHIRIVEKKTGKFKKFPVNAKLKPMFEEYTKGKKYYAENIKRLRYLLDEAYQQMQQGQYRYAVYDADSVMRETLKIMLRYENGGYVMDDLLMNIKICEQKKLLGTDKDFISRLYDVYHICECERQSFINK